MLKREAIANISIKITAFRIGAAAEFQFQDGIGWKICRRSQGRRVKQDWDHGGSLVPIVADLPKHSDGLMFWYERSRHPGFAHVLNVVTARGPSWLPVNVRYRDARYAVPIPACSGDALQVSPFDFLGIGSSKGMP